jgi:hypothetical protein
MSRNISIMMISSLLTISIVCGQQDTAYAGLIEQVKHICFKTKKKKEKTFQHLAEKHHCIEKIITKQSEVISILETQLQDQKASTFFKKKFHRKTKDIEEKIQAYQSRLQQKKISLKDFQQILFDYEKDHLQQATEQLEQQMITFLVTYIYNINDNLEELLTDYSIDLSSDDPLYTELNVIVKKAMDVLQSAVDYKKSQQNEALWNLLTQEMVPLQQLYREKKEAWDKRIQDQQCQQMN